MALIEGRVETWPTPDSAPGDCGIFSLHDGGTLFAWRVMPDGEPMCLSVGMLEWVEFDRDKTWDRLLKVVSDPRFGLPPYRLEDWAMQIMHGEAH